MLLPLLTLPPRSAAGRSKACMLSKGNTIWPYTLGMNMKNEFKGVLYFVTVINRYIFTFHILAFL